jgi:uncharacterized protein (TIGR02145 family)
MKTLLIVLIAATLSGNLFGQTMTIHLKSGQRAEYSIKDIEKITYSNGEYSVNQNYFVDSRDGHRYRTVRIGNQLWMAENLNYDPNEGSMCYENSSSNCSKYGRLYTYKTATNVAPPGWHLANKHEFEQMINYLGGNESAYFKLIQGGSSNFDALSGGMHDYDGNFAGIGESSFFWCADRWFVVLQSKNTPNILWQNPVAPISWNRAFSVRCIKD